MYLSHANENSTPTYQQHVIDRTIIRVRFSTGFYRPLTVEELRRDFHKTLRGYFPLRFDRY